LPTVQSFDSRFSLRITRIAFWIIGIVAGAVTAYTTRYFINGDAIAYIEMGEALRFGHWWGLANLTYSPGFPVLLGVAQKVLHTNPLNELQILRCVNFVCLLLAMGACDLLMTSVRRSLGPLSEYEPRPLPSGLISALCYSMFLVASLALVRVRLINPDMLVFFIILMSVIAVLWIREEPSKYIRYVALGVVTGIGYLSKSFFFVYSPILFVVAGLAAGSLRKAAPRVLVSVLVMLLISSPLMGSLSHRLGRFTYGELGKHVYALWISGKGEPIHPRLINETPRTFSYPYDIPCTRPAAFDICYWHEGFKPDFNHSAHMKIIPGNVAEIVSQTPWLLIVFAWFAIVGIVGGFRPGRSLAPPSLFLTILIPAVAGIGFYCLIHMETRYIAPFLFLAFVGVVSSLRCFPDNPKSWKIILASSGVLVSFFLGLVVHTVIDQSLRGLRSTAKKPSYRATFQENVTLKDYLLEHGLKTGDSVAIVESPPVYWARLAGLKITSEIPNGEEFLSASPSRRQSAIDALKKKGVKALLARARGSKWDRLKGEGWAAIDGTRDWLVILLNGAGQGTGTGADTTNQPSHS
jgi:hypothetical protein